MLTNCKLCGLPIRFHFKSPEGYVLVPTPNNHPEIKYWGYRTTFEHTLVAEKKIGRNLKGGESVHHINHIRDDNRPQNLAVMANDDDHAYIHKHSKKANKKCSKS